MPSNLFGDDEELVWSQNTGRFKIVVFVVLQCCIDAHM